MSLVVAGTRLDAVAAPAIEPTRPKRSSHAGIRVVDPAKPVNSPVERQYWSVMFQACFKHWPGPMPQFLTSGNDGVKQVFGNCSCGNDVGMPATYPWLSHESTGGGVTVRPNGDDVSPVIQFVSR